MYERLERRVTAALARLTLRKAVGVIVAVAATLATAAAVLERLVDPEFDTFGSALWFSITTVSTVGYGDYVPETAAGRVVAAALMLTGLGMIPLITSVVVSILVAQRNREAREESLRDLQQVLERLDSIDQRLEGIEPR
ncbi:MAG TPA: potassium channel family protein [Gaiellaceae bacterium]|nr:potassium channel family protein [Gaiellaceae bacterium]